MELIVVYVMVIGLFAGLPIVLDICLAYWSQNRMRRLLLEKASADKLTLAELKEFAREGGKPPPGIPGLARATMAITVIVILGIAVFHLLAEGGSEGDSQIINNVLSMLAGLLAAITGFYFGGKAAEKKTE
ncbi:MAG: hypothetical protein HY530_02230 [Chloroflexi bacterium]|nr:hypothetical protein [Chloroflexota bacterium]